MWPAHFQMWEKGGVKAQADGVGIAVTKRFWVLLCRPGTVLSS